MRIALTRYTAHRPARLSKKFTLREGKLHKESGGQLSEGVAERLEVAGISGLADLFKEVSGPAQALSFGINGHDRAWVVPKEALEQTKDKHPELPVIARDRDHIHWSEGPGIAFLDFDPADGQESLERGQLLELLYAVWPALRTGPHMWRPSASSCIFDSRDDKELRGIVGQHIYASVKEPADLPRAGQVLIDRTWLAGHGWIKISASGSLLLRTPVDAMFQPERLDFAAAECASPLVQRLPEPMIYNPDAEPIDTRMTLPDLTEAEAKEVLRLQAEAKAAKAEEAAAVRARWEEGRLGEMVKRNPGAPKEQLREVLQQAVEGQVLYGSFILYDAQKRPVTVAEMLAKPREWHHKYIRDPLEPEYGSSSAWVCIDAKGAFLWSHAHGLNIRYDLKDLDQMFPDEPAAEGDEAQADAEGGETGVGDDPAEAEGGGDAPRGEERTEKKTEGGAGESAAGGSESGARTKGSGLTAPAITEDEMARAQLTPTCIVENMLYADVGVVSAPGGVGKTTQMLYIAACIRLGLDVFGERVVKPGRVLILTAEDSRQILVARLREIAAAMFLDAEQMRAVMDGVRIADVSGLGFKLTEVVKDMVLPYETNIDAVLELGREVQPVVVMVDPAVSFGVGESRVNDAEQGLIEAGRRLRNELRCCVLYIHHTGKANARDKTLDQYTGRGGSSFADGSRMVLVMQNLTAGEFVKATGQKLEAGETGIVLARPKISFCPPQGEIYIKRTGYWFNMVKASVRTPEQAAKFAAAKVYEFLEYEYQEGRRYSTSDLENMTDRIGLPRKKIREALIDLKNNGRAIYHEVKGKSGSHWQPVTLAEDGGDT